jgi:hypothetical protein
VVAVARGLWVSGSPATFNFKCNFFGRTIEKTTPSTTTDPLKFSTVHAYLRYRRISALSLDLEVPRYHFIPMPSQIFCGGITRGRVVSAPATEPTGHGAPSKEDTATGAKTHLSVSPLNFRGHLSLEDRCRHTIRFQSPVVRQHAQGKLRSRRRTSALNFTAAFA